MPLISKKDFEEMIRRKVEETGIPEEKVRLDAETVARLNGYQIEESDTISLVEHFAKSAALN